MSYLHDYLGLLGCLLFLIASPLMLLKQPQYSRKIITIAIFFMMGLAILPINNLTLLAYIRAGLGDLSITSMILLCLMIATSYTGRQYFSGHDRHQLYNSVLIGAAMLYPLGLGLSPFDTYALGYGNLPMFGVLLLFSGYLLWRQTLFVLTLLLLAIAAYLVNALPSTNLWDYLLDPWLAMLSLVSGIKQLATRLHAREKCSE